MSGNPVSQTEFHAFRVEMRDYMQQQTKLMSQMVELQTKHSSLANQVERLDTVVDKLESRLRPLEQGQSGNNEKTKYNRDLIWLMLSMVFALAGFALRGGA